MSSISDNGIALSIPFSPPFIDEDVIKEVTDSLQSGWITTGPKVKELELLFAQVTGIDKAVCVNSWTSGAGLVLKWLGIGAGDEVIIPAYTYAATALCVLNAGAIPVMVDITEDFTICPKRIRAAITSRTKAVIGVDVGGWPCDYDAIVEVLSDDEVKAQFNATNAVQSEFGRPVLIIDAAHSVGAMYKGESVAKGSDITIFSLHAVKNITTAEGGVICIDLPAPFNNEEVYAWMKLNSMNGQTRDAYTKNQSATWRYDIVSQGLKINMPDVCAAIGLAQLRKYSGQLLPDRQRVFNYYKEYFSGKDWAIIPSFKDEIRTASFHLFQLRINNITELQRDNIIKIMTDNGVATNVHFIPLPLLTLFKDLGYNISDYPQSYSNYLNEISLPIYPQLTTEQCAYIVDQLEKAYRAVQ